MADLTFATPYQANKILAGVVKALNNGVPKRPNWFSSFYPTDTAAQLIDAKTLNFDQQKAQNNLMGVFADPKADVNPVALETFGHKEVYFSYAKEFVTDGDEDEDTLDSRQLGQQFGQNDLMANYALRLNLKFMRAEQRFQNLQEKVACDIALYGGYSSKSEYHHNEVYDFGRTKATVWSEIKGASALDLIPSVNLTASAVTAPWDSSRTILPVIPTSGGDYTQGEKKWTTALVDAGTATPYLDVVKAVQTCAEWDTPAAIHMSGDAYTVFNYDIEKNYKAAAETTTNVILRIERDILPRLQVIDGLTFQRMITLGNGISLPIYTYKAKYNDRSTGTSTSYVGNGWLNVIPSGGYVKAYGRIRHPKAQFMPMPRWMNNWSDEKTGLKNWEWHSNFVMASLNINALVAWKVC